MPEEGCPLFSLDWLNYLVRWAHLIFGISWIGSSFYFMWLDSHLEVPEHDATDVEGMLWMTHSGGFYQVLRKKIGPGTMPKTLHWFKYEALFTWVSGIAMLTLVYYLTGGAYLVDPAVFKISANEATLLGLGLLVVSWLVYDGIWITIGKKHARAATGICLALVVGLSYLLCQVFSGRGAFIHLGAIFGTLMVANVWMRILPSQQKMIDATTRGEKPDFTLSGYAKRRSVHNTYMTFPVLFMMLSNHYAMAYGSHSNWIVLLLLVVFGMSFRHVLIAKHGTGKWALVPAAASLVAMLALSAPHSLEQATPIAAAGAPVTFTQVRAIVQSRCIACHSPQPRITTFGPTPAGVNFEDPMRIKALADRINVRVVQTKTMPFGNRTGMTDEERGVVARWIQEGAPTDGAGQ